MKNNNYHYKQSSVNNFRQNKLDNFNEYGYNFDFESKRLDNEDTRFQKLQNIIFINTKR